MTVLSSAQAAERLIWPAPPDAARIEFAYAFSTPDDLGIKKGLLARVADLLFGASEQRLIRPMSVVAQQGEILVADPGVKGVHRFASGKSAYTLLRGHQGTPLNSPVGLAHADKGEYFLTDSARAELFIIRPGADEVEPVSLDAKLVQPTGVAYDAMRDRLYITDTAEHCIKVFRRDGRLIATIGRRGRANGEFNFPTYLWLDAEGQLLVTDSLNFRIQTFAADGRFISTFGRQGDGTGDAARQKGIATDRYGHLYVTDALFNAVQIFDSQGQLLLPLGGRGSEPGEFLLPAGLFIDKDDMIYVADSHNRRVQVFRYIGGAS